MAFNPFCGDAERYRFESIYANEAAGWNIGRPQDAVRYLVESDQVKGKVLDVGCGTGLQTRYLASRGLDVLGVDFSGEAVHRAKDEARRTGSSAEFLVWNALELSGLNRKFDTVLDSAMMHCLNRDQRPGYVRQLSTVLRPGGILFLLCSQESVPLWELEELFSEWGIEYVLSTSYMYTGSSIPAYLVAVRRP